MLGIADGILVVRYDSNWQTMTKHYASTTNIQKGESQIK